MLGAAIVTMADSARTWLARRDAMQDETITSAAACSPLHALAMRGLGAVQDHGDAAGMVPSKLATRALA